MAELKTDIVEVHKKERKELQAKIQNLKHSVAKGDKKKKKEVNAQIALLEAELSERHERELSNADTGLLENGQVSDENGTPAHGCEESKAEHTSQETSYSSKRISKAQKRRDKIASEAKKREEYILQEEINNLNGARSIESQKLEEILSSRGLAIHEVPSDGDCLYKAVEHQLSILNIQKTTVAELRKKTSDHMLQHRDDFISFLIDPGTGDVMSNEQYNTYCHDTACKPTWGGQVEIQALSQVCSIPIEVIQADGPSIITGEHYSTSRVILSYHRHMYGLGEHYNSIVERVETNDDF